MSPHVPEHVADLLIWFHEHKAKLANQLEGLRQELHTAWEQASQPGHSGPVPAPKYTWQWVSETVRMIEHQLGDVPSRDVGSTLAALGGYAGQMSNVDTATADELALQLQWVGQIAPAVHELYIEDLPIQHPQGDGELGSYLYTLKQVIEDAHTSYNIAYEYCEFLLNQRYGGLSGLEQAHKGDQPLGAALGNGPDDQEVTGHLFGVISHLDGLAHYLARPQFMELRSDGVAALRSNGQWIREQVLAATTGPARQFVEPGHYHQIANVFHEMAGLAEELLAKP